MPLGKINLRGCLKYIKWYKVKTYKEDYTNQQSFYSDLMENQMFYKQAKA